MGNVPRSILGLENIEFALYLPHDGVDTKLGSLKVAL